ncbi:MAG: PD40 domain-containing protein [Bacteroidia bacterium]|nr:PD40 domain-containing protein [Bacteroidia bacterium]
MTRKIIFLMLVSLFLTPALVQAQKKGFLKTASDKRDFDEAELLFMNGDYDNALKTYEKMERNYPNEPYLIYKVGCCNVFVDGGFTKAIENLSKLDRKKFRKTDLLYYLGRAYHLDYRFEEAIALLNEYRQSKWASAKLKLDAERVIKYCQNGIELMKNPGKATVKNLEGPLNTSGSEYVPVLNMEENIMYFTYRGEKSVGGKQVVPDVPDENGDYFEDIFTSRKTADGWTSPEPLSDSVNTTGHDANISLSADGLKLFMFMNPSHDPGQIAYTFKDSTGWIRPRLLKGDIESGAWEGSVCLSFDEKMLFFASERSGGEGKKDIYIAFKDAGDKWNKVKGLGKTINTEADEDAPFLHPNGLFLIFASNGRNSMGGYDLFYSEMTADSNWSEPVNLGYPINTPGDDIYFHLSLSGKRGYYSSDRKGGYGKQDLYLIENPFDKKFAVQVVQGVVTVDDLPAQVEVLVYNSSTGALVKTLLSDPTTGRYFIYLPRGAKYEVKFKYKDLISDKNYLNTIEIQDYTETNWPIKLYTEEYRKRMLQKQDSIMTVSDTIVEKTLNFQEVLILYGDKSAEGLVFKVQVGAFSNAKNFDKKQASRLGKVENTVLSDGITRFTVGTFNTLNKAQNFKSKAVKAGIDDAFITAIYKGERVYLKQIVHLLSGQK